jgi:hypothetical protein
MHGNARKVAFGRPGGGRVARFEVDCQSGKFFWIYLRPGIELTISVIFPILSRLH